MDQPFMAMAKGIDPTLLLAQFLSPILYCRSRMNIYPVQNNRACEIQIKYPSTLCLDIAQNWLGLMTHEL